jgi:hypothetical protein
MITGVEPGYHVPGIQKCISKLADDAYPYSIVLLLSLLAGPEAEHCLFSQPLQ